MQNIKNTSYLWDECCSLFPEKRIDKLISNHKLCSFRIWESTSDLTRHSDVLFCILALKNPLLFTIGLTIYLNLIILPHCTQYYLIWITNTWQPCSNNDILTTLLGESKMKSTIFYKTGDDQRNIYYRGQGIFPDKTNSLDWREVLTFLLF